MSLYLKTPWKSWCQGVWEDNDGESGVLWRDLGVVAVLTQRALVHFWAFGGEEPRISLAAPRVGQTCMLKGEGVKPSPLSQGQKRSPVIAQRRLSKYL